MFKFCKWIERTTWNNVKYDESANIHLIKL